VSKRAKAVLRPAPAPITGHYQMSVWEQVRHIPELNRGTRFTNASGAFLLVLGLVDLGQGDVIVGSIALLLSVALFSGYYSVPFGWLTLRRNREAALAPVDILVNGEAIRFDTDASKLVVPWENVNNVRETRTSFLVRARYPRAFMVPKRAFEPQQLDAFRLLAASKVESKAASRAVARRSRGT
jgi:hypothetical protein